MIGLKAVRRTAALNLALIATMTMAAPAMAACGLTPEAVAQADVAFVGLLADVSADGNSASFQVEEIWRGSGLAVGEGVAIDTTNSLQSLDLPPSGAPAPRYLVLASVVGGQLHTGDSCEVFPYPWDAAYAAFRPADAPPPAESDAETAGGFPSALVAAAAAVVVLVIVGLVAFRRGPPG
jgi:hypothetical protein